MSANGNLLERGADEFVWDYEDRMVEATVNSVVTTFAYRGDGLRNSRTVGMTTTTFTWDITGGLPVVLDDGNQYVYGAGLSAMKQGGNWVGILLPGGWPRLHHGRRGRLGRCRERLHLRRVRQAYRHGQPRERV